MHVPSLSIEAYSKRMLIIAARLFSCRLRPRIGDGIGASRADQHEALQKCWGTLDFEHDNCYQTPLFATKGG